MVFGHICSQKPGLLLSQKVALDDCTVGPAGAANFSRIWNVFTAVAPVAGFSAPDSVIDCEAIEMAFVNQSSANALGFVWLFPGGVPATSTDMNPVITYSVSGIYPVTLIAFNATGSA